MTPFIKKLSYKNADKQIQKLLEISCGILKNKWIKYKFDIEYSVFDITR